jgi:hypothetical protein
LIFDGGGQMMQLHSNPVIELLDLYQVASVFGDVIVLSEH